MLLGWPGSYTALFVPDADAVPWGATPWPCPRKPRPGLMSCAEHRPRAWRSKRWNGAKGAGSCGKMLNRAEVELGKAWAAALLLEHVMQTNPLTHFVQLLPLDRLISHECETGVSSRLFDTSEARARRDLEDGYCRRSMSAGSSPHSGERGAGGSAKRAQRTAPAAASGLRLTSLDAIAPPYHFRISVRSEFSPGTSRGSSKKRFRDRRAAWP